MLVKLCVLTEMSLCLYNKLTVGHDTKTFHDLLCQIEENGKEVVDLPKIIEVLTGKSFTDLSSLDIQNLKEISLVELKACFNTGKKCFFYHPTLILCEFIVQNRFYR